MIGEQYYQSCISIRKTYIKLMSEMSSYKDIAEKAAKKLESSISEIEVLKAKIKKSKGSKFPEVTGTDAISKINEILNDVEGQGLALEKFVEPINKELEKLAKEEQMLYAKICEAHPNLEEQQIVEAVSNRLKKEGLM
jgi:hypothetical protein